MKAQLLWLAVLLFPGTLCAQGDELSVRLYWLRELSEVRIAPQRAGAQMKLCADCQPAALAQVATVHIVGGRLQIGEQVAQGDSAEIFGNYRLEVPGHAPLVAAYPLTIRADKNHLAILVRIPRDAYVAGVLAGEAGTFVSRESLKALAVAARTYAVHFRGRHRAEGFDFCDTTHCQDLRLTALHSRFATAAEETEGELLWFEGRPAATFYHRHCGGTTEAVEHSWPAKDSAHRSGPAPFLRQQSDGYCIARGREEWRSEFSRADLHRALAAAGFRAPAEIQSVEVASRTPSGRVARLRINGSYTLLLSADEFRLAVGRSLGWQHIRSDLYEIAPQGEGFAVRGFGAGHGVGLCQAGAARMGELGRTHREILQFYYPGATPGLTAQGLHWQGLAGERVEVLTTRPPQDGFLVGWAERTMREMEEATAWRFGARPQIRVYPSVEVFRNATGKSGWVAASTTGRVIRTQPVEKLRAAGTLDSTLRHELLHLLVESRAHRGLPLWFREGIVLVLAGERRAASGKAVEDSAELDRRLREARTEEELRRAYDAAQARVEALIVQHGKTTVLGWVERGLPSELLGTGTRR
jgi:stage II sporulation protein D